MTLINIRNLSKYYYSLNNEFKALNNINLDIIDQEFITLIGPSGCGKSTLLNIIGKLESTNNGTIIYNKPIKIGYMMQSDVIFPWLNVYDNAILGLKLLHIDNKENIEYTISLLNKYNLGDFLSSYPNELSGGMKQRLALIRILATKPNILLLDEPFSKLDIKTKRIINDDIYKIVKELGITTILVSHDIEDAVIMSNRIVILSSSPGEIKEIIKLKNSNEIPSKKNDKYYKDLINYIGDLIKDD